MKTGARRLRFPANYIVNDLICQVEEATRMTRFEKRFLSFSLESMDTEFTRLRRKLTYNFEPIEFDLKCDKHFSNSQVLTYLSNALGAFLSFYFCSAIVKIIFGPLNVFPSPLQNFQGDFR